MGIVQRDALRTTIISYAGMILGYLNKVFLFLALLSTEEMGLLFLVANIGTLFAQFSNLGTINTVWKFLPYLRNKEKNHQGFLGYNLLILGSGIVFFTLIALVFEPVFSAYFQEKSALFIDYYYWIIPIGIGIVLYRFFDSYARALYKNVYSVFVNEILFRILTSILLGFYWLNFLSFHELVLYSSISFLVPALLMFFYLMKIGEWHVRFREISIPKKFKKIILSYSLFSYVNTLSAQLVISLDAIMIAAIVGLKESGVYMLILFMMRALMVPYASIMRVSSTLVAQHWRDRDMVKMDELYKRVSSISLFIGLYCFLGVWISRVDLFSLLPDEYAPAVYVFLFLMSARIIDMYMGLNGTILVTSKKYRYDVLLTGTLIIIVFALNLLLIPIWGMIGAAFSTATAYLVYNLARLIFVWVSYKLHPFTKNQVSVILLFGLVLTGIQLLPYDLGNVWVNIITKSVLVTVLFPGVIYLAKFEPEIVNYVNKIVNALKGKLTKQKD
ncbi:MAG: O-antigen/teichoic acid export membrane protein [Crocinitomicaceae bacterium]|jgi:O-antigen/teichoic acid export membrane protein